MSRMPVQVIVRVIFCAVVLCACVIAYIFDPEETTWLPKCYLHEYTGILCAGCGNTRALHALLHGRIAESLGYNLLLVPLGILFFVLLWKPNITYRPGFLWGVIVTIALFTILRNIPCYPFTLLAP